MVIYAYSYRRISSYSQQKGAKKRGYTKEVDSLDTQALNAQKWVDKQPAKRNVVLDESLVLEEVVSGSTGQNIQGGALGMFLEGIVQGKIATPCILLIDTWSRFSRQDTFEQIQLFTNVTKNDVTIVTLNDEQEYTREKCKKDPVSSFIPLIVKMAEAAGVSDNASRSGRITWERRLKDTIEKGIAFTSRCPFWLSVDKETKKYVVDKDKAEVVKKIFKLAIEGKSNVKIASALHEEGIKTSTGKDKWNDGTIANVLMNEAVIGWHNFKKRRRETNFKPVDRELEGGGYKRKIYPPIISESDYQKVRDIRRDNTPVHLKARRRRTTASNIFSYLLRCGYFGCSMRHKWTKDRAGVYNSSDWALDRKPNYRHAWKVEALEDAFINYANDRRWDLSRNISDIPNREKTLRDKVQVIANDVVEIENVIETYWNDLDNSKMAKHMRDRIIGRIDQKEKEKDKLNTKQDKAQHRLDSYLSTNKDEAKSKTLLNEFYTNRNDIDYKRKLNVNLRIQIDKIELFGGGVKYDKKEFNKQLSRLEEYIKTQSMDDIVKERLAPPEECPSLSTDLWVGLDQDTYSHCFYLYEIFWQVMIGKHIPSKNHPEAYSLLKRIPHDDMDNRFFVVHHTDDPWADIEGWSRCYSYRTVIKPYETYTKKHSAICEGLEWVGEWDSIRVADREKKWTPLYYCKLNEGNPIIQHINPIDKTLDFGRATEDGKYNRTLGRKRGGEDGVVESEPLMKD